MFTRLEIAVSNGNRVVLDFSKPEEEIVAILVSAIEPPVRDIMTVRTGGIGLPPRNLSVTAMAEWEEPYGMTYSQYDVEVNQDLIYNAFRVEQGELMKDFFPNDLFHKYIDRPRTKLTEEEKKTIIAILDEQEEAIRDARNRAGVAVLPTIALCVLDLFEAKRLDTSFSMKARKRFEKLESWRVIKNFED